MIFKKLDTGDVLRNTIKVYPKNSVFVDTTGSQYIRNIGQISPGNQKNSSLISGIPFNLSSSESRYFTTIDANTTNASVGLVLPSNISLVNRYNVSSNKDLTIDHRLSSSLSYFLVDDVSVATYQNTSSTSGITQRYKIFALENTLNWYASISEAYNYSNYSASQVSIINIPSIFYGNSIKQGSVELNFYVTGTLIGQLTDFRKNGELVQTFPVDSNYTSSAGVVLYNEGFFLITGSWGISSSCKDHYLFEQHNGNQYSYNWGTTAIDVPRWVYFGKSMLSGTLFSSSSFEVKFQGVDFINTITIFAHADKNEFNNSNNPTSLKHSNLTSSYIVTGSNNYVENPLIELKNTIKTPFSTISGSFKKQTFINKIGIFDKDKKLIAVAKLATPVKKNNERDYTFKLKLDI